MSKHKHNYTQYSNKPKVAAVDTIPSPDHVAEPEIVNNKPAITTIEGVVSGCAKLNVRQEPNLFADVICTLDAMSEIEIIVEKSTKDWFYICTAIGAEGYCMRKYVEAHM